jgi:putative transposase
VSVSRICKVAKMSRQNYYKRRAVRQRRSVDEGLVLELVLRERAMQPKLGTRKLMVVLKEELEHAGVSIGRDRFFAVLSRNRLLIERRARSVRTTKSGHGFAYYENLLKDVELSGARQAIVSDITYIRTDEGFMYLALVMDAYSRAILGYDCSDSLEAQGALRALSRALRGLPQDGSVIHHSDRGIQYCCGGYVGKLKRHKVRISMTEENHCYENARAERLNGILKGEYGLGGRLRRKADAVRAVAEAVRLYNWRRPHQALNYRRPMEVHSAA